HGFLNGGFSTWQIANEEIDRVNRISAEEFEKQWHSNEIVFDVRKDGEFNSQHVRNAHHSSLALINEWVNIIPANQHFYLHCQGGYRSMIAASILKARGYHNFSEIDGGFK